MPGGGFVEVPHMQPAYLLLSIRVRTPWAMGFLFQAVGMGNVDKKCLLVGAWMPLMGGLASTRASRVCLLLSALFCVIRVRNAKGNSQARI